VALWRPYHFGKAVYDFSAQSKPVGAVEIGSPSYDCVTIIPRKWVVIDEDQLTLMLGN
jgi:hypothetical protein